MHISTASDSLECNLFHVEHTHLLHINKDKMRLAF